MDLVSVPVVQVSSGRKRKWRSRDSGFDHAWRRTHEDVERALRTLRKPALNAICDAVLTGADDGADEAGDPLPVGLLVLETGSGEADRFAAFRQVLRSLQSGRQTLELVKLRSDEHQSLGSCFKAYPKPEERLSRKAVLCIADVEQFAPALLQDLIYTVARQREDGLRVASGSATGPTTVVGIFCCVCGPPTGFFQLLGGRETTMLDVRAVELPSTQAAVDAVIADIILKRRHGPYLTKSVYDLIMNDFILRESTLAGFLRSYRMMFLTHIMSLKLPLQELLPSASESRSSWTKRLDVHLTAEDRRIVSSYRSVSQVVDKHEPISAAILSEWLSNLVEFQTGIPVFEQCFASVWGITSHEQEVDTPLHLAKKIFEAGLEGDLKEHPLYQIATRQIQALDEVSLERLFDCWRERISGLPSTFQCCKWQPVADILDEIRTTVAIFDDDQQAIQAQISQAPNTSGHGIPVTGGAAARSRRNFQLASFLEEQRRNQESRVDPRLRALRIVACRTLDLIAKQIHPVERLVLHELVAASSSATLRKWLGSDGLQPLHAITHALQSPADYDIKDVETCAAYEVLNRSGRNVDIFEWLRSFTAARERMERDSTVINGQFARAAADLEYLGFTRRTARRSGSVLRLIFKPH